MLYLTVIITACENVFQDIRDALSIKIKEITFTLHVSEKLEGKTQFIVE